MKTKQIEVIKNQYSGYLNTIGQPKVKEPDEQCHIVHALVRGENVPLRTSAEISNSARDNVASCSGYRSDRNLSFSKVFSAPASFRKAQREYEASKAVADRALLKFKKEGDALLLKAELDPESEAGAVSDALRLLAIRHGIDA